MKRLLFVALSLACCRVAAEEPRLQDAMHLAKRVVLMKDRVRAALLEDDLWSAEHRSKELLRYLEFAERFPSKDFLPMLLRHSTYRRNDDFVVNLAQEALLAQLAITAIGPAAVPAIVERLKRIDWDVNKEADWEGQVLVLCLEQIYLAVYDSDGSEEAMAVPHP